MSEQWEGPGWWFASDGKWYPSHVSGPDDSSLNNADLRANLAGDGSGNGVIGSARIGGLGRVSNEEAGLIDLEGFSVAAATEDPESNDAESNVGIIDLDELEREAVANDSIEVGALAGNTSNVGAVGEPNVEPLVTETPSSEKRSAETSPVVSRRSDSALPASVTRTSVGSASGSNGLSSTSSATPRSNGESVRTSTKDPSDGAGDAQDWDGQNRRRRGSLLTTLLVVAAALAILSGLLGSLWLRERAAVQDLRAEAAEVPQFVDASAVEALESENETLRLQNEQLEQQLTEMSALVLELPAGRVTEIELPFDAAFADESVGRLLVMAETGEYLIFGNGTDNPFTDSGTINGAPTGLYAAGGRAWVSSEAGGIEVLALNPQLDPVEGFDLGPVTFLNGGQRVFWAFSPEGGAVIRVNPVTGRITDEFIIPSPVVDIALGAGSMWALGEDGVVYRVNTADLSLRAIDAGDGIVGIAASPDALWSLSASDGSLRRIDPVTGAVLVTVPVGRDPIDVEFAGSSIWVGLRSGSSLIEVDTRTSAVVSRTELSSEPARLFQGDENVFVSTAEDAGTIFQVDPLQAESADTDAGAADAEGADAEGAGAEGADGDGS